MLRLIFSLSFISFGVQAKTIEFRCTNADQQRLSMKLDERIFTSTNAPDILNIEFKFNGQNYRWNQVQYLSLPLNTGEIATLIKEDPLNKLYIQQFLKSANAQAELTLDRKYFEFDCQKMF